jgi:hypothetical protein
MELKPCHGSGGFPRPGIQRRSGHVGFVVDIAALVQVFSEYFCFPCQSFHPLPHTDHHPSSWTATVGQTVADVPSGLSLTKDGGEWLASRPCRYSPGDRSPCAYSVRGWVFPRIGLDAVEIGLLLPRFEPQFFLYETQYQVYLALVVLNGMPREFNRTH